MSAGCLPVSSLAKGDVYINVSAELVPKCPFPKPQGSLTRPHHEGTAGGFSGGPSHGVPHRVPRAVPERVPQRNPR